MLGLAASFTEWLAKTTSVPRAIKTCKRSGGHRMEPDPSSLTYWRCVDCPYYRDGGPGANRLAHDEGRPTEG